MPLCKTGLACPDIDDASLIEFGVIIAMLEAERWKERAWRRKDTPPAFNELVIPSPFPGRKLKLSTKV